MEPLQPPGPSALRKKRATYKNTFLTPYKLLTTETLRLKVRALSRGKGEVIT